MDDIKILRDSTGFPTQIEVKHNNKTYVVTYDGNGEIKFNRKFPPEVIDKLKLIYPFAEKGVAETLNNGALVSGDALTVGLANTTLYTVPAHKVLYIIAWSLSSSLNGVAGNTIDSDLHFMLPGVTDAALISCHYWTATAGATDGQTSSGSMVDRILPSGTRVRTWTSATSQCVGSIIGVIKDA